MRKDVNVNIDEWRSDASARNTRTPAVEDTITYPTKPLATLAEGKVDICCKNLQITQTTPEAVRQISLHGTLCTCKTMLNIIKRKVFGKFYRFLVNVRSGERGV